MTKIYAFTAVVAATCLMGCPAGGGWVDEVRGPVECINPPPQEAARVAQTFTVQGPRATVAQEVACSLEEWGEWPEGLVLRIVPELVVEVSDPIFPGGEIDVTARIDVPLERVLGMALFELEDGATFDISLANAVVGVRGGSPTSVQLDFSDLPLHVDFDPNGDGEPEDIFLTSGPQTFTFQVDQAAAALEFHIESFEAVSENFPYLGGVALPSSYGLKICELNQAGSWAALPTQFHCVPQ